MNQDIDFIALWEKIRGSIDWLSYGIVGLLILNLIFGAYFVWTVFSQPGFYNKYKLNRSEALVRQAKNLESVPPMADIQVEPPEKEGPLPERYAQLREGNLFIPLGARLGQPVQSDTQPQQKQRELPRIEGYEIVGRITGEGQGLASMLRRTGDGKTFVAREGEFLANTDIKVKTVSDTLVRLTQPDHKPTNFQFKSDQIKEKIRRYINLH